MRGTQNVDSAVPSVLGIIPAHAGNTGSPSARQTWNRDHPRACGEHDLVNRHRLGHLGSSPRMRGTLSATEGDRANLGIIPAHAGNTGSWTISPQPKWDHPRACGEHAGEEAPQFVHEGSSPRMRGTPSRPLRASCRRGIIPAHAGNTQTVLDMNGKDGDHPRACGEHTTIITPLRLRLGDHPRACGEHFDDDSRVIHDVGSSPRMRGTLLAANYVIDCLRIIPAHAGNTGVTFSPTPWSWDHPRACGEHRGHANLRVLSRGSSPRMRGTPGFGVAYNPLRGIIPAHAGNTGWSFLFPFLVGDHPRACGEHIFRFVPGARLLGSSPRMRGTHC